MADLNSAAIMDEYLESPLEGEENFPCKGCGEVSSAFDASERLSASATRHPPRIGSLTVFGTRYSRRAKRLNWVSRPGNCAPYTTAAYTEQAARPA